MLDKLLHAIQAANLIPTLIIAAVGILAIRMILKLVDKSISRTRLEKAAVSLIHSVLKVVLWLLLGLIIASRLGIDVTGVVALASVASLALSLALQDALANVIGGFTLLSNHPFRSGDYVEIAGQAGTVQTIDITYTKLTTPDNKTISIPNSAVVASQIVNYSTSGTRRIDILIRADYGTPIEPVKAALLRSAQLEAVLTEPAVPLSALRGYVDGTMEFVLQVWVSSADYWPTLFTINENIQREFDAAGIKMTRPQLNVHLDN